MWFSSLVPPADKARWRVRHDGGLPCYSRQAGFRITLFEAGHRPQVGPAFTHVTARLLAESPSAILSIEGFDGFVASAAASIATGRSDPIAAPGLAPAETQQLFTAH
jgi:hypothetical protein